VIIVGGYLTVDPTDRQHYLDGCAEVVRLARAAPGCIDFALGADTVEPARVNVYECWASEQQLHDFRESGPNFEQTAAIIDAKVREFSVLE
jgi:quinol monooxygenase YgiN